MSTKEDNFLLQLRATFKVEAEEHLQTIADGLLELESTPSAQAKGQIVETVFRAAHSLKGAARAVGFSEIELLCQSMEDVFASWKRQESLPSPDALDTLHRVLDAIASAQAAPVGSDGTGDQPALSSLRQALRQLGIDSSLSPRESAATGLSSSADDAAMAPPVIEVAKPALPLPVAPEIGPQETVRVTVSKLEARLLEAEEMLMAKLTVGQRVTDLRELSGRFDAWRNAWGEVEPEARQLRLLSDQPGSPTQRHSSEGLAQVLDFFDWSMDYVKIMESEAVALERTAQHDRFAIGKLVDDLLEDSKQLLMLPFASISASFQRLVRDLCRDQGKEAELKIYGENTEIDKRILEEMKDPLIHLLRNSLDHGIETAAERRRRGKPSRATIELAVTQISGNKVRLMLSDNGAGIDTGKVKASAIKLGLISPEEAAQLSEPESQALIFRSEVSTSPIITQLSGRGLGLAIVREKTTKLGGEVTVDSQAGLGTVFQIELPATRATFRGILVKAAGRLLVLPTAQVERAARATPDDTRTVEGRETITFDGRAVSLVRLADVLELPYVERKDMFPSGIPVLILGSVDQRVAFAVDEVLDEQEILVKPLLKPLSRVRNVAAAAVLSNGKIATILNVDDLLKSARKVARTAPRAATGTKAVEAGMVLIAEDSITSRMLLKSILESAGYDVKTAVDGMDAFTLLRAEKFDLLVSDVEMPRLNGFDLTAKIRADKRLAELPVVLVTALETREDRERGIDAGANAYIVKSSFDQSNLIEAVRRLI
ncbi:hybrid sensor histidine kinase/response regulator [Polaromonas sp. JS666]|uniref:hybrid sensor histidine kinase/response regulator n=1 Tax=Polaromonas sp. (strain JS666 / ATCC BAA-500) TaxID=296591 RepID=UPI000046410A|nr:response regulator [Polaromonas sp. JS666]ABE44385.1 CheA signal transduction histidine kinase [Polaromonas sp. JS666]